MAENKKSFILYCDQKGLWDKLDNEQAGKLIKHIIAYVNDENPETDDFITQLAFEPIKQQLKRDLKQWEDKRETRSIAGKAGAEARWQKIANDDKRINSMAKMAVNDNVTVNVNEINVKFNQSIAKILNKPYEAGENRGLNATGQDIDSLIKQLRTSGWDESKIETQAKAMKAVYAKEKWSFPSNYITLITSLIENDWVQRLKELDPEQQEKIKQNGKQHRPEPDIIGSSAPGSLD